MRAVTHEVRYQYAMWAGRYTDALDAARSVLACLLAPELRGYRALWHYLAGNAAVRGNRSEQLHDEGAAAREQFRLAARAVDNVRWIADLARYVGVEKDPGDDARDLDALRVIERLEGTFVTLGSATNYRFDAAEQEILTGLLDPSGKGFEPAQVELGRLLGYDAGKVNADASPDPWWCAGETMCFVFEDHAGAGVGATLDATKARQAATHDNWVRANVVGAADAEIVTILVTPATRAAKGAVPHLATVLTWPLASFRDWAKGALSVLRELKKTFREPGDIEWQARALEAYRGAALSPKALKERAVAESGAMKWTVV
jgi:hypothetical protein